MGAETLGNGFTAYYGTHMTRGIDDLCETKNCRKQMKNGNIPLQNNARHLNIPPSLEFSVPGIKRNEWGEELLLHDFEDERFWRLAFNYQARLSFNRSIFAQKIFKQL